MGIWARIWPVLALTTLLGAVLAIPLAWAAVSFLRDRIRYRCSYDGSFICADGNGYALAVLALGFCVGVLLLATAAAAAILSDRPPLATRVTAGMGIACVVFTVGASIVADSGRNPASLIPDDTWSSVMAKPALILAAAGVALALVVVSPPRFPKRVGLWVALLLALAATGVELTLAFGTVPVLFAVVIALSTVRTPVEPIPVTSASAR